MAANNQLIRGTDRATMLNTAYEKTLRDADLADIEQAFLIGCRPLLEIITNPVVPFAPLDKFINETIHIVGKNVQANRKRVKNMTLKLLHSDPSFANAYHGDITVKKHRGDPTYSASKDFAVALHESHRILSRFTTLIPDLFGGHEHDVERFHRVLLVVFRHFRALHEAMVQVNAEKDIQKAASRQARQQVAGVLADHGVNPRFGTLAIADRKYLNLIAPGEGSQKDKIRRARDSPELKVKSCSAELNPHVQGLRSFVHATLRTQLSFDETFQDSNDQCVKRRRVQAKVNNIMDAVEGLVIAAHQGMDEAAIHRDVYNPLEYAKNHNEVAVVA